MTFETRKAVAERKDKQRSKPMKHEHNATFVQGCLAHLYCILLERLNIQQGSSKYVKWCDNVVSDARKLTNPKICEPVKLSFVAISYKKAPCTMHLMSITSH